MAGRDRSSRTPGEPEDEEDCGLRSAGTRPSGSGLAGVDTRKSWALRHGRGAAQQAPVALARQRAEREWPQAGPRNALALGVTHPACATLPEQSCEHALTNRQENARLFQCEQDIKARFEAIVPALQEISGIARGADYAPRAQEWARERLGFGLPEPLLERAWVRGPDMGALHAAATFSTSMMAMERFSARIQAEAAAGQSFDGLVVDCGFHAMNVSACSDGRLKGLFPYILRVPASALVRRSAFAGTLFDVEADTQHWEDAELRRFREGFPTTADANTRYLKVAVYHGSSLAPQHEGCAAHGSNERAAIEAAVERLSQFREAIENAFCCGASTDILLIGVDTDTDSIRIHVPDANGDLSPHRYVDNADLYRRTLGLDADRSCLAVYDAIRVASETVGWGQGHGMPHDGMRRLIATLLINNLSQIEYVGRYHGGWYADAGHGEYFVGVGDGFQEVQVRNIAYYAHLDTVEEGAPDLDVGVKIFRHLNVERGLPIPMMLRYRFDARVPGSRERMREKVRRVAAAIRQRYPELAAQNLLCLHGSIQDLPLGGSFEEVGLA